MAGEEFTKPLSEDINAWKVLLEKFQTINFQGFEKYIKKKRSGSVDPCGAFLRQLLISIRTFVSIDTVKAQNKREKDMILRMMKFAVLKNINVQNILGEDLFQELRC